MTEGHPPGGTQLWSLGDGAAAPSQEAYGDCRLQRRAHPSPIPADRAICGRDMVWLAALLPLTAIAWLLPVSHCERLSRAAMYLAFTLRPGRYAHFLRMFRELLPAGRDEREIAALVQEATSLHHLERLLLLRLYRPIGWHPRASMEGREHVERALAEGRGAILWVKPSSFSDIMAKAAFHQAGFSVSHLSRHTHGGFSTSRLGVRLLNRIRTRAECRYLAQRVVIDPGAPGAALQRLAALLAQNQLVSITVGAEARRLTWVPVADGSLPLAGGAAKLAVDTGAPLLPVFTERLTDGSFRVTVEAPIQLSEAASAEDSITRILFRYGALLGAYFVRLPEQYHCLGLYLHGLGKQSETQEGPADR